MIDLVKDAGTWQGMFNVEEGLENEVALFAVRKILQKLYEEKKTFNECELFCSTILAIAKERESVLRLLLMIACYNLKERSDNAAQKASSVVDKLKEVQNERK